VEEKLQCMTKVLRIINRFNLGGPTYNVAYLSKYISPEYETLLVGGAKDDSEESSDFIVSSLGLKPVIIPEMKREIDIRNDYAAYKKLCDIIREFKPDIVHTHASKAGTLGRLAAFRCGVPVIVHTFHGHVFHSYFGKLKTTFYKNIERYLAKRSTAIIAISEKQKSELADEHKICSKEKIHIVPLGFDLSKFREDMENKRRSFRKKYNVDEDEIVISIIGRIVPVKNHPFFLAAIKELSGKSKRKIRAFIIGDGESRSMVEQEASKLEIAFSDGREKTLLTFTSWIREIDVALAGSDIITLCSFNEGTPVSLIEAQAAGKPVVTTNVGGIGNIVLPGKTALLSDNGDISAFAENLLKLTDDDQFRENLCKESWNFVRDKFHYTRLVADMENLYRKLLSK
jgi:glycosyltransferase involved in cell wall biosynthesis